MTISNPYLQIALIIFLVSSIILSILRYRVEYKKLGAVETQKERHEKSATAHELMLEKNRADMKELAARGELHIVRREELIRHEEELQTREERAFARIEALLEKFEKRNDA